MIIRLFLLLVFVSCLGGCGSFLTAGTADVAGIASAGVSGAITKNPTVAAGIGLGIASGASAGLQYAERIVHGHEQDRIAEAAGALQPGQLGHWSVSHDIPIEADKHGDLIVTRLIGAADITCKEIVFSVDDEDKKKTVHRSFYTATVCLDGTKWKWATAEPATARWGALQ